MISRPSPLAGLTLTLAFLAGCTTRPASTNHPESGSAEPTPTTAVTSTATPSGPSSPASSAAGATPVVVDTSCKFDADCTVKDVGNCCGAYPACVNVKSPTDPEGVRARCAKEGRMGVCGFPTIEGCQCVAGACVAKSSGATGDAPR